MKGQFISRVFLIVSLVMSFVLMFFRAVSVNGQAEPTTTSTVQAITETAAPIVTATLTFQQQTDDLLKTYKEVLDTSKSTVEEVHTTTDKVLTWVGILFSALTISGLGGAALLSFYGKNASDKANAAQQKATEAFDIIQKTESKTVELEKRNVAAIESTNELTRKQNHLLSQLDSAGKLLLSLQTEITQLKRSGESDRQVIKKPLALVQIDEYGMQALSGTPAEKNTSILSLIEMTSRPDAVVQRRAVKALGALDEYDERVVKRLKEIIESNVAQGVRKEAEKSSKLLELKKPKKITRRKS